MLVESLVLLRWEEEQARPGSSFGCCLLNMPVAAFDRGFWDAEGAAGGGRIDKGALKLVGDTWGCQATGDAFRVDFLIDGVHFGIADLRALIRAAACISLRAFLQL